MDKAALKSFAIEARKELINKVKVKASYYGFSESGITQKNVISHGNVFVNELRLTDEESIAWNSLNTLIKNTNTDDNYKKAYTTVIEEVAYTWFNRFVALKYMEVHEYLPSGIRIVSSKDGGTEPDILKNALNVDLDIDKNKVYALSQSNELKDRNKLYKYLVIKQCDALADILPFLFDKTQNYMELLFPDNILGVNSFVGKLAALDDNSWQQVEVVGWLYQYYISDSKDIVFAKLKKGKKITKEEIAPATQIFTPDWIVQYMVQNSLGKLCEEVTTNDSLNKNWKYYIKSAEQELSVQKQLKTISNENSTRKLEELTIMDPSMGSGHILVYAFDLLYEVYLGNGYLASDIPKLIIENNLYGIDIDERAYQIACFALMMKGRERDKRFFNKNVTLNLISIEQSDGIKDFFDSLDNSNVEGYEAIRYLVNIFYDAKEYGSIIKVEKLDYRSVKTFIDSINKDNDLVLLQHIDYAKFNSVIKKLAKQAILLSNKYDVLCTNPPYMGNKGMGNKLSFYLKSNYPSSKSDLFAVFMELYKTMVKKNGYNSMVTMQSWMFLKSYELFRKKLIKDCLLENLMYMDNMVMGIAFGTAVSLFRKCYVKKYVGTYNQVKLVDLDNDIPIIFPNYKNKYNQISSDIFKTLPGNPIAFWASESLLEDFKRGEKLGDIINPKVGLQTGNNDSFLRQWYEVNNNKAYYSSSSAIDAKNSGCKWFPYNKGGARRQWYGNYDYLVNWENDGYAIKHFFDKNGKLRSRPQNQDVYFKESITWPLITSGGFSIRYRAYGSIHDVAGMSAFSENKQDLLYLLALMSTKIANYIFKMLNPTLNLQIGDFCNFPVIYVKEKAKLVLDLVESCISISKKDWNQFETAWDFKKSVLLDNISIKDAYYNYKANIENIFILLKSKEETLNEIFIDIYGLQNDLTCDVLDKDITITRIYDTSDEIPPSMKGNKYLLTKEDVVKQFISYAVGCMFGRYSLDEEGLIYAGGTFDSSKYIKFPVDLDNVIPITDTTYFEDDMVERFYEFVRAAYGEASFEENIEFIANALNNKGESKEIIRNYFNKDFYKDHLKMYKKRPIYWMFDSGKENGFKALIYMHRYNCDTLARVRTDYLLKQQNVFISRKNMLKDDLDSIEVTREKKEVEKQIIQLEKKIEEIHKYDELLHHMADKKIDIDLDDGVVVNYAKFDGLLSTIK